jgi:hypothetical protein
VLTSGSREGGGCGVGWGLTGATVAVARWQGDSGRAAVASGGGASTFGHDREEQRERGCGVRPTSK